MPVHANGQELEASARAQGQNLELTLTPFNGTVVRLLAFRNTARMGDYREALALAAATGAVAQHRRRRSRRARKKYGFGVNGEQPLADEGETGVFAAGLERRQDGGLRIHRSRSTGERRGAALGSPLGASG